MDLFAINSVYEVNDLASARARYYRGTNSLSGARRATSRRLDSRTGLGNDGKTKPSPTSDFRDVTIGNTISMRRRVFVNTHRNDPLLI